MVQLRIFFYPCTLHQVLSFLLDYTVILIPQYKTGLMLAFL